MERKEILKILREYPLAIESHNERFKMISESVTINDFCFRDVSDIHLVGEVLWIGSTDTSIDVDKINNFRIRETEKWNDEHIDGTEVFKIIKRDEVVKE